MVSKITTNVVWLKRDLRLSDHQPLTRAIKSGLTLLYYVFEPDLINDPHYDERHWRFVWQSIEDINSQLAVLGSAVFVYFGDPVDGFNEIEKLFHVVGLFSHEEVGLQSTFSRDKLVKAWCVERSISWHESVTGAVIRGAKNRKNWDKYWHSIMQAPLNDPKLSSSALVGRRYIKELPDFNPPSCWSIAHPSMLKGGEAWANRVLVSFLHGRGKSYHLNVSKP